jgi:hypothetical protein
MTTRATLVKYRAGVTAAILAAAVASTAADSNAGSNEPREVTIPAGTVLRVRVTQPLTTASARVEQPVPGVLDRPLVVRGETIVPAGSAVYGEVSEARRSARVKGRARLGVRFHTLTSRWSSERYALAASTWRREAPGTKKKDAVTIAAPAAGGAVIGGILDGKKGAAIGAATGGGAGTAVVLATRGQEVSLPRGSVLAVRLTRPLRVQVAR